MAKDVETSTIPSTPSVATSEEEEQSSKSDTKLPKKSHAAANLNNRCSVCFQGFTTLQECLKHELLEHSLQKKNGAKNGTNVESRIKATIKSLKSQEKQEERRKVHTALVQCQKGQELPAIMKHLCMDNDSLVLIFTRIQTCLEKELRFLGPVRIFPFGSIASRLALRGKKWFRLSIPNERTNCYDA